MMSEKKSVFHLIADVTEKEGIPCVLIGGYAVNHYQVSRQTADVDFMITRDDFGKIMPSLEEAGYKKDLMHENFVQLKGSSLSLMDLDFMFVEPETLSKILDESREIKLAGKKFLVPAINHLIALKLHAIKYNQKQRLIKDFPDIVRLIRYNDVDFRTQEFKDMCGKYGPAGICDKIVEACK